jgi:hypothetical protein
MVDGSGTGVVEELPDWDPPDKEAMVNVVTAPMVNVSWTTELAVKLPPSSI